MSVAKQLRVDRVVIALAVLVIAYLVLIPVFYLLWGTFSDDQGITASNLIEAYSASGLGAMIVNSLGFAIGSTILATTLGTAAAFFVARTDVPIRRLTIALSVVPLVLPGVLHTVAWVLLASPRVGLFNRLSEIFGGPSFDIFGLSGMIIVEGLHLTPLVFLLMLAAFSAMDPSLEEAALVSGARIASVIRRISLPLVAPALLACALVVFIRTAEAFEVPALIGIPGGVWVFTSRIWRSLSTYPRDFGVAGSYSLALLLLTMLGVFLYSRLVSGRNQFATVSSRGMRPKLLALGRWRPLAGGVLAAYLAITVAAPVCILAYASTQRFYSLPSADTLLGMTLDNYRYALTHDQVLRATRNSLLLGIGSATVVLILTSVAAWVVVRGKKRSRWVIDGLASLPIALPGLVLGVALIFVYLRHPLPIYGTLWILLIAFVTRYLPYGMRYGTAAIYRLAPELEESARTSGATWLQSFRRIVIPLIAPGLLAGWIYIAIVSIRELSSSIMLYSPGNEVLSVLIWEQWQNGQFTELAAIGILMVSAMGIAMKLSLRFVRGFDRSGRSSEDEVPRLLPRL